MSTVSLAAQRLTVFGGITSYDLSGTGSAAVFGAAVDLRVPLLRVGGSLSFFRDSTQFDEAVSHWFPEVGAYLELAFPRITPYIGGGVGFARRGSTTDATLHGALGVHASLLQGWGARLDGRIRAVDPFHGTTADLTVGVSRALR